MDLLSPPHNPLERERRDPPFTRADGNTAARILFFPFFFFLLLLRPVAFSEHVDFGFPIKRRNISASQCVPRSAFLRKTTLGNLPVFILSAVPADPLRTFASTVLMIPPEAPRISCIYRVLIMHCSVRHKRVHTQKDRLSRIRKL